MVENSAHEGKEWSVGEQVLDGQGIPAIIAYVGETQFATGRWIGLIFDQPIGKNNGIVQGVKYFECEENHGRFVRENQISSMDGERRGSSATSLSGSTTSLHSLADPSTGGPSSARGDASKKVPKPNAGGIKPPSALPASVKVPRQSIPASGLAKPGTSRKSMLPVTSKLNLPPPTASESKVSAKKPIVETSSATETSQNLKEQSKLPVSELRISPEKQNEANLTDMKGINQSSDRVNATNTVNPEPRRESIKLEVESAIVAPPVKVHESAEQAKLRREQEIEIEKLRLQVQQLEFNKTRMTEVHGELQKQLDAARREVREALEAANSDEMTDLRDSIELLTIDKEMAEEKRDQLASELEDLKLKFEETNLELEMLQHEVQEGGQGEASTNFRVVELEKQNVKLKDGLVQLRDILNNEKADRHRLEKEVKALKDGNEDLEKMAEKLQAEALRTTEVVADLREQVDAALGSEEMVERLIEEKLDMEDKLRELSAAVHDYESMADFDKEMIELNSQTARQLREEVEMARADYSNQKSQMAALQQTISDSSNTVHKFRDLTRQLQHENSNLREQLQLQSTSSLQTTPTTPMTIDFRLKIQDEKSVADRLSHRISEINGKMLTRRLGYVSLFMPDLYATSREESFLQICLIPEQISLKLGLICEEINQKFELPSVINQATMDSLSAKRRDEITYGLTFVLLLKIVETWDRDIDYAIRSAAPDAFSVLNELENQLQRQDDAIQYYVDQLKQSRLDEVTSLEYLEMSAAQMQSMMARLLALDCNQRTRMEKLKDVMDIFTAGSRVITAVSSGLKIGLKDHGPEVAKWLTEFIQRADDISDIARKIKRPLDTDNELRAVMLPDYVQTQLRHLVENIQRVVALCYTWYRAVGHQASLQVAEQLPIDGNMVKTILYSENDRGNFYKSTAASPQQSMLNSLDEALGVLRQFSKEIEDGQWTRAALKAPEMPKIHPLRLRADILRKSLADAEDLKSKIITKDEEILEFRKNLRAKVEEVSELQLRRSMTEKKLVTASKTEDEKNSKLLTLNVDLATRLTKLQEEYDNKCAHLQSQVELLQSEKSQMEEKLKQTSKRFLSVDMSPVKSTGKAGAAGDHNVAGQVEALRQVIASLRADVVAVKSEQVRRDLEEKLPPLKPPVTAKRDLHLERIGKLKRQVTSLEMQRVVMFARTAVDFTKPKEERQKLLKERRTLEAEFQLKMRKIHGEILELTGPGRFFVQETGAPGV